ncbi:MAG: YiiD C-terminal domain-containing protein [Pseudomonadales bacterium]|nr:YiiD C-terminal domain-containing protein [Pseudomonadales bacterium]
MGMTVAEYDGNRLSLAFPLAPNINDKGTGFAGSLNAATTYCAWSLLHLFLKQKDSI